MAEQPKKPKRQIDEGDIEPYFRVPLKIGRVLRPERRVVTPPETAVRIRKAPR